MSGFPVSDEAIRALRLKILRSLVAATYPEHALGSVAGHNDLTIDDAKAMVAAYGYPDHARMRNHILVLEGKTPAPAPAPKTADSHNAVERLLAEAGKSKRARTKSLAAKILVQLNVLRQQVLTERQETEASVAAAVERARLKAEVDQLEAALAEKKKLLRPGAKAADPSIDNKAIREWAAKHSVACPAFGRVPRDVIEAYELATKGAA
jgi:hypothetical protein